MWKSFSALDIPYGMMNLFNPPKTAFDVPLKLTIIYKIERESMEATTSKALEENCVKLIWLYPVMEAGRKEDLNPRTRVLQPLLLMR